MIVHRIAATTPDYRAHDLSGKGAAITGGRWNRAGLPMLYCASHLSLAMLETLVHLGTGRPPPRNRYHIEIEISDAHWAARRLARSDPTFPVDWDAHPVGAGSVTYGSDWLEAKSELVLIVPSVAVPSEENVLLNPAHPDFGSVRGVNRGRLDFDHRLFP
ncbi:MAG: RES family NAD+ phosphorylase [Burkholderiales bacterium]|nr:RES family NAD+ phosphorylase [Burkholderiales bacterium]